MQKYSQSPLGGSDNERLNLRAEIEKYLRHWKWFLLGVIVSFSLVFLYLRYTTPMFNANASILDEFQLIPSDLRGHVCQVD